MIILVLSCDKNTETFEAFHHCMEKYWQKHPTIIYYTESVQNPFYRTISVAHELWQWTKGVKEVLKKIKDEQVLIMVDDCFIRRQVDTLRVDEAETILANNENIAMLNFEQSWDPADEVTEYPGWKRRTHGSRYEVSIMCGLWNREKLIQVLEPESDPWEVEYRQNTCDYDYYTNSGDYIIDWGYRYGQPAGIFKGKWCREIISFFETEGISMDYSKKGFCETCH